ncbi:MAG: hypothetical protein IBX44_00085 [Sulfurospirillum sp.]|nr:hypothetical protein [Sulfurospirillum sp.]
MRIVFITSLFLWSLVAGDFEWMREFDGRYTNNQTLLQKDLSGRFSLADAIISDVIQSVTRPAEAYMVLKLSQMSGKSTQTVLKEYHQSDTKKGWGALAKSMGIKPGSKEFKALKAGDDIYKKHDKKKHGKPQKDKKDKKDQ